MKSNQFIAFIATSMMVLAFSMPANAQFGNQQRPTQQGQERRGFHHRGECLSDKDKAAEIIDIAENNRLQTSRNNGKERNI